MTRYSQTHEDLAREDEIKGPTDRSFGITFAVVFSIVGLFPLLRGRDPRVWALAIAALFLAVALLHPAVLAPLNRLWLRFGLLLHRVVSPLVMGMLFYLVVTPTGFLLRLFGKRPLRLQFEPAADTYWIPRQPPGPAPDTMKNQF